jgi:hypothetical protein
MICVLAITAVPASAQFNGLGPLLGGAKTNPPNVANPNAVKKPPGFNGLGSLLGGAKTNPGNMVPANMVAPGDLRKNLTSINVRFAKSLQEMLLAEAATISALGDKDEADKLSSEAKSLDGQNDLNTVSRSCSISEDAAKEIDSKMSSSGALDSQARAVLASAVPHYALAMLNAAQLPKDYESWIVNAQATVKGVKSDLLNAIAIVGLAGQLGDVLTVTVRLPDLISAWSSTTNNFGKFANDNQVDTSDLSKKI